MFYYVSMILVTSLNYINEPLVKNIKKFFNENILYKLNIQMEF